MLNWAKQFNIFCFLDNQQYAVVPHGYECLLGAGAASFRQGSLDAFQNIDGFINKKDWLFGHLSYELLHPLYKISSTKKDLLKFPQFYFFKPQVVLYIKENRLYIDAHDPDAVYSELRTWAFEKVEPPAVIQLQQRFTKQAYMAAVQQLQQHILRGDCYEVTFCQEFFADGATIDPYHVFQSLMLLSPAPFSVLYKWNDKFLICASPERFLLKQNDRLIAQPIKGTAKRSADAADDLILKTALQNSAKEQAENVMIVDLMRNDLSKICEPGSVTVDELFGLYTFPQLHQLISTVSGTVPDSVPFSEIIKALFPMGSMTGAPKQRVLQLIDEYEPTARGIFSGSVGYIAPGGNFDFNVVIRSIMYNQTARYLSCQVGSAITFYSDAEREWEECLLKASALKKVMAGPLNGGI